MSPTTVSTEPLVVVSWHSQPAEGEQPFVVVHGDYVELSQRWEDAFRERWLLPLVTRNGNEMLVHPDAIEVMQPYVADAP